MTVGKAMVQAHGYNALSFREIGKEVGISSASVHHYFPTKGDLAAALARRYTEDGAVLLSDILVTSQSAAQCIDRYTDIFRAALLNENRMCLCGIMGAEYDDLPAKAREEVDKFVEANIVWLAQVLALKKPSPKKRDVRDHAMAVFAAVEGAQLVARGSGDITIYDKTIITYRSLGLFP